MSALAYCARLVLEWHESFSVGSGSSGGIMGGRWGV